MPQEMTVINVESDKIRPLIAYKEMKPVAFHFKRDGAKDGSPSIAIEMISEDMSVFGQMSLNTLAECLAEVGYAIIQP